MCTMSVIPINEENSYAVKSIFYNFIWNGQDKLKRKTLEQIEQNGGIGIPNIFLKQTTKRSTTNTYM